MLNGNLLEPPYTADEKEFRALLIKKIENARNQREKERVEFDDASYTTRYVENAKIAAAYLRAKLNDNDVRIESGISAEKIGSVLSYFLGLNLDQNIISFDDRNEIIEELGEVAQKLIFKSEKTEGADVKWMLSLLELLAQGTCFKEETLEEYYIPDRAIDLNVAKLSETKWIEKKEVMFKKPVSSLLSGLNVYLGNINEFDIRKQPFVATRSLLTVEEARAKYEQWERWKYVVTETGKSKDEKIRPEEDTQDFHNWSLEDIDDGMVEEFKYYEAFGNNYMVMLNGVLMFPVKKDKKGRYKTVPLSSLLGKSVYPIAKGDLYPISSHFAYSRSISSKMRVEQILFDEIVKGIILSERLRAAPPMANNTGRSLSKDIFYPNTIHDNINSERLTPIIQASGVQTSQLAVAEFVQKLMDNKSVNPLFEGQQTKGNQTATEIQRLQQQSMQKLAFAVAGVISLKKQETYLRLFNILKNSTDPVGQTVVLKDGIKKLVDEYQSFSIDVDENDLQEIKIKFVEDSQSLRTTEQLYAYEQLIKSLKGRNVKIYELSVKDLKNMDMTWYIEIVPTEKKSNALKVAQFQEFVATILSTFVPLGQMPNIEYLKKRYTTLLGEDPEKVWGQMQNNMQQMQMMGGQPQQGGQNQILGQLLPKNQRPSVNTMVSENQ